MVRYHLVFSSFWFSDCVAVIQLAESCPITSCCFLIFVAGTADQERPEVSIRVRAMESSTGFGIQVQTLLSCHFLSHPQLERMSVPGLLLRVGNGPIHEHFCQQH